MKLKYILQAALWIRIMTLPIFFFLVAVVHIGRSADRLLLVVHSLLPDVKHDKDTE